MRAIQGEWLGGGGHLEHADAMSDKSLQELRVQIILFATVWSVALNSNTSACSPTKAAHQLHAPHLRLRKFNVLAQKQIACRVASVTKPIHYLFKPALIAPCKFPIWVWAKKHFILHVIPAWPTRSLEFAAAAARKNLSEFLYKALPVRAKQCGGSGRWLNSTLSFSIASSTASEFNGVCYRSSAMHCCPSTLSSSEGYSVEKNWLLPVESSRIGWAGTECRRSCCGGSFWQHHV